MIERCNFLDLLGADSRKYHSCIITSYSFDILYFEQIVLPRLRKAGILNVNIFIDAGMFQKQLQSYSGKEYLKAKRDYSVTPIYLHGAFHTKMIMALGKSKGMLAVGSGNITASGLSNNEEIWATFHLNSKDNLYEPVFAKAAHYLAELDNFSFGVNYTKLQWIPQHSEWYRKLLQKGIKNDVSNFKGDQIKLLASNSNFSFLQHISENYPMRPKNIKILSPYYNRSGKFLQDLINKMDPENVHCIIDSENGTYPFKLEKNSKTEFSDWVSITKNDKPKRRLHAKALQIEYEDQTIFLFGSANATSEAYGNSSGPSENSEAMVEIISYSKKDFFDDLGIHFPLRGILDLSLLPKVFSSESEIKEIFPYKIRNVQWDGDKLNFHISGAVPISATLKIEDADSNIMVEHQFQEEELSFGIVLKKLSLDAFKCSFWKEGLRISDFGFLENSADLLKTNPDERLARFNEIRNHEIFDDLGIETFLNFLNTEKLFHHSSGVNPAKQTMIEDETIPEAVSSEEFNKYAAVENFQISNQAHITTLVEDFLSSLIFGNSEKEEISDNTEEAAINNMEEGMAEGTVVHKIRELSFSDGIRIRKKLDSVLLKINNYLSKSTDVFYNGPINHIPEDKKLNLNHLNALIIGFGLILKYLNQSFSQSSYKINIGFTDIKTLEVLEKKFSLIRRDSQFGIPNGQVGYNIDINLDEKIANYIEKENKLKIVSLDKNKVNEIKHNYFEPIFGKDLGSDFLITNLGSFLYSYHQNLINIESGDRQLFETQLRKLMDYSILLLLEFYCPKRDKIFRDLLFLNIFYILKIKKSPEEIGNYVETLKENYFSLENKKENVKEFLSLYKRYFRFKKKLGSGSFSEPLRPSLEKEIVFSTKYGFSIIGNVKSNNTINLITPLGTEDIKTNSYGFKEVYISQKVNIFPQRKLVR